LYGMSENLSKALQKEGKSAIEGQRTAKLTLETLHQMMSQLSYYLTLL